MSKVNRQWLFREFVGPDEMPGPDNFKMVESEYPVLEAGQILVRIILLGTSPAQRMYISAEREFHIVVEKGEVMQGRAIGEVIESQHPEYQNGDIIQAGMSWQDYVVLSPDETDDHGKHVVEIEKFENPTRPLTTTLGLFGQLGCSAWVSMIEIAQVKEGDSVLISAAAGGVGSIACQLARVKGAKRVVGIAGGADKTQWLLDKGLCDAAIDYKNENLAEAIPREFPDDIDVFLDNVGGETLDLALKHIAVGGRLAICGSISTEYQRPRPPGPTHYYNLIYRRARMEGFFVFDYLERWPEFIAQMQTWYQEGKLQLTDHVFDGLEYAPEALGSLFSGGNTGGCVIRVSPDPESLPALD